MKKNTFYSLALMVAFSMSITTLEAQIQVSKQQDTPSNTNIAIMEKEDENKDLDEFLDRAVKDETVEMAQPEKQNIEIDYLAPLSGGVLLLVVSAALIFWAKEEKNKHIRQFKGV